MAKAENEYNSDTQQQKLEKIQSEMKSISQDQKALTIKKNALEGSINSGTDDLRTLSRKIQSAEQERKNLNKQINELSEKELHLEADLQARKQEIDELILALIRLKKVPPEIMLLQPDSLLSAAQGSMVLSGILPDVEKKLKDLSEGLEDLSALRQEIEEKKAHTQALLNDLSHDRKRLERMVEKNKTDLYNTNKDLQRRQLTLSKLSREAEDIEDLMQKISALAAMPKPVTAPRNRNSTKTETVIAEPKQQKPKKHTKPPKDVVNAKLSLPDGMPVVGSIDVNYGDRDDLGAQSQGWTISTDKNAIVTAPFSGTVKYTGAFKRYGQIILIQHDADYFTLMGGVSEIYVLPETEITKGTPLARMGQSGDSNGKTHLYYEVRYKGKAVNPKRLLSYKNL